MTVTTTYDRTTDPTNVVLAQMLTENTGAHFLDSGGAYGRNYERNAGKAVADLLAEPEVSLTVRESYFDITWNVFHFLSDRLEYDAERDQAFHEWAEATDDSWLTSATEWAHEHGHSPFQRHGGEPIVENTYNHESALSQIVQFVAWSEDDDESYVALQIHGGCDVRGGYTSPRIFRAVGGVESMFDDCDVEMFCDGSLAHVEVEGQHTLDGEAAPTPERHWLESDNAGYSWRSVENCTAVEVSIAERDGEHYLACPSCGSPMQAAVRPGP